MRGWRESWVVVEGTGVLEELGRFSDTKHTSDSTDANARIWAALESRLEFLLYGNFMPISPQRATILFFQLGAANRNSSQGVKVEDKKKPSALHPQLIDQKDTRKTGRRSSRPARNPPTGRL